VRESYQQDKTAGDFPHDPVSDANPTVPDALYHCPHESVKPPIIYAVTIP
jgi:hypothetical protein